MSIGKPSNRYSRLGRVPQNDTLGVNGARFSTGRLLPSYLQCQSTGFKQGKYYTGTILLDSLTNSRENGLHSAIPVNNE